MTLQIPRPAQPGYPQNLRFGMEPVKPGDVPRYIDHTKLTYKATENPQQAIEKLCQEAKENNFFAVCVRPDMIRLAKNLLQGTAVKVATVIGFPADKVELAAEKKQPTVGDVPLEAKQQEARQAVTDGADELDLVMNVCQFKGESRKATPQATVNEFKAIKDIAGEKVVKVIIETDLLTPRQIEKATEACAQSGVDMVKTSTGMVSGGKGATVPNVELIRDTLRKLGASLRIKASGGVKSQADALDMIHAGASRLGTSSGVAIVQGQKGGEGY